MAGLGIKPGEWLNLTKAQLRSQQRPDKMLKVQLWATGMLHTAGYQGEEVFTMRNDRKVPLTPGAMIAELYLVAKEFYAAQWPTATKEQLEGVVVNGRRKGGLKETKEDVRAALDELEREGLCRRTDLTGTPLHNLSIAQRRRLSSGKIRLFFWARPQPADPGYVVREWDRQTAIRETPEEVGMASLPTPPISLIFKIFRIGGERRKQITADPDYHEKVEKAWAAAQKTFEETLEVGMAAPPIQVAVGSGPEVAMAVGAFESNVERGTPPWPPSEEGGPPSASETPRRPPRASRRMSKSEELAAYIYERAKAGTL